MKIQENYFYKLDNSKEVKVIWKKYDKANILEIGFEYPTAIVDIDRLSGIKLNEELLLKFGFVKDESGFYIKINEEWQYIELNDNSDETENLFIGYITSEQMKKNVQEPIFLNYINYVHELQNLYYSLTGEELVVSTSIY